MEYVRIVSVLRTIKSLWGQRQITQGLNWALSSRCFSVHDGDDDSETWGMLCALSHHTHHITVLPSSWRRQWPPTPVLLLGKSHGQRSLVGCSPWGRKESDTTERLHFHFSLSCVGEGNGNPLQSSCLENPRDGGAWWAAIYGVAQSRTRLKWLSSSSSRNEIGNFFSIFFQFQTHKYQLSTS